MNESHQRCGVYFTSRDCLSLYHRLIVRLTTPAGNKPEARWPARIALLIAITFCSTGSPGKPIPANALRVLFIGNSLTYTNDLPSIIAALAEADGQPPLVAKAIAFPDFSLEDHWQEGSARKAIAQGGWEVVVMQQGPSALPASRVLLLDYARRFAQEIRRAGATPALYMVWPSASRMQDFKGVTESYRQAADTVAGKFFPAGEAWLAAWRRDPKFELYSSDGLHPTTTGSYLAALVIYAQLYGRAPAGLPARLKLRSGKVIDIPAEQARLLQTAAAEANEKFARH
jgi:hypothetical protein